MSAISQSLEYILELTYRQHEFLWERYLYQEQWKIQLEIKLNPWISKDKSKGSNTFDASTDAGLDFAAKTLGLSVKERKRK